MQEEDFASMMEIYKDGIEAGNATFQNATPNWEDWNKDHLKNCRLVAKLENDIVGWAALTPVSGRCVFAGVAELSIYISLHHTGKKIGTKLLEALIKGSEQDNIWTLQSGIFPENAASLKIHQNTGFRIVGTREKMGKMNGVWRDVILLERRSETII